MTHAELVTAKAVLDEAYERTIPLSEWIELLDGRNELNEKIIASMTRPESERATV